MAETAYPEAKSFGAKAYERLIELEPIKSCLYSVHAYWLGFLGSVPLWITPDILTGIRIFCILPIIYGFLNGLHPVVIFSFVFGALLDRLDGELARFRKQETELGKFLDPAADKLLILGTLIFLAPMIDALLFWSVIAADALLAALSILGKAFTRYHIGSNAWGRMKMLCQSIGIACILIGWTEFGQSSLWMAFTAAVLSIIGHIRFGKIK